MIVLIIIVFFAICLTIDFIIRKSKKLKAENSTLNIPINNVFNEDSIIYPKGLCYDKTHTWAFMEENGLVKIGIDDFLLHITGNLNKLKLKNIGEKIKKGEAAFSIIQDGKQLVINAPISGTIRYTNNELSKNSSTVNTSPYNEGWIYAIEPSNWLREFQFLILPDKYKEWLKTEFIRLKDYIASSRLINNTEAFPIVLQDGGELNNNMLANFGPEVWEDFQINFINSY